MSRLLEVVVLVVPESRLFQNTQKETSREMSSTLMGSFTYARIELTSIAWIQRYLSRRQ